VQLQIVLDSQSVGMLRLETGSLKATYTSTLSSAQATIAMLMVVAGRRAAEAAIDKLQGVSRWVGAHEAYLPRSRCCYCAVCIPAHPNPSLGPPTPSSVDCGWLQSDLACLTFQMAPSQQLQDAIRDEHCRAQLLI